MKIRNISKLAYRYGKKPEEIVLPGRMVEMEDKNAKRHLAVFPNDFVSESDGEASAAVEEKQAKSGKKVQPEKAAQE